MGVVKLVIHNSVVLDGISDAECWFDNINMFIKRGGHGE